MSPGWLVLAGIAALLLWPHVRRELQTEQDPDVTVTIVDPDNIFDEYVLGLGPGDAIISPRGVEVELGPAGWSPRDVVAVLGEIDSLPEVEAA